MLVEKNQIPSPLSYKQRQTERYNGFKIMKWQLIDQSFNLCLFQNTKKIEKNMSFDEKTIKSSDAVELLGIALDKNIDFK